MCSFLLPRIADMRREGGVERLAVDILVRAAECDCTGAGRSLLKRYGILKISLQTGRPPPPTTAADLGEA